MGESAHTRQLIRQRGLALVAAGTLIATLSGPVVAADPVEVVFTYTGAEQTFVVPDDVTDIHVALIGGHGGTPSVSLEPGRGHRVEADLPVTPGQVLYVEVGGNGGTAEGQLGGHGGFNGGGTGGQGGFAGSGGGGASDIRTVPRSQGQTLASRLVVAGGGGGVGSPGLGGDAGGAGGDGSAGITGGAAGTASAGGDGGQPNGASGALGFGGAGGPGLGGGGGGGGAGYYGGGGGGGNTASGDPPPVGGAGGGGGSSYTGGASNASVVLDTTGVPSITITYTPGTGGGEGGDDTGTVSAQVDVIESAACIELANTFVDFGTLPLGAERRIGTPEVQLTNCGVTDQAILTHGTDAAGAGAAWSLVDFTECSDPATETDQYGLGIILSESTSLGVIKTNRELTLMPPGAVNAYDAMISTACPGSSGAGSVMSMQLVFVATEAPQD